METPSDKVPMTTSFQSAEKHGVGNIRPYVDEVDSLGLGPAVVKSARDRARRSVPAQGVAHELSGPCLCSNKALRPDLVTQRVQASV